MNVYLYPGLSAFSDNPVGSKVIDRRSFLDAVSTAIEQADFTTGRVPGQLVIPLPVEATKFVSGGVGKVSENPEDYFCAVHRGTVGMYLRRHLALPVDNVSVVVHTVDAYRDDPEFDVNEEPYLEGKTHVLVAVLAFTAFPRPFRLEPCGNNEALGWSAEEIREKSREITEYHKKYHVVAG